MVLQPAMRVLVAVSMIPLQPLRESYTVLPFCTDIEVSPVHALKDAGSILVTEAGILMLVKLLQASKAQ